MLCQSQHWDCAWMMILFVLLWAFILELPCACLMFAITAGLKLANSAPMVSSAVKVKAVTPVTQASTASSRGICLQQVSQPTLNPLAYAVLMANVLMVLDHALELWSGTSVGCYMPRHSGPIPYCLGFQRARFGRRTGRAAEEDQVCGPADHTPFHPHWH